MAITANVDLGNGVTASSCYIIVSYAYVKKFRPSTDSESATFKLIYDVDIYQNKSSADTLDLDDRIKRRIVCREVDHFKIDYDTAASDNPFVLAYTHLKTNGSLSSVADA
jgi:hypothetical protein